MSKIPCEVIQDLIPLVKDHVASKESEALVQEHLQSCETCRSFMNVEEIPVIDDKKVLKTIQTHQKKIMLLLVLVGLLTGLALTLHTNSKFWNLIIIPLAGILLWILYPKKCIRTSALYSGGFAFIYMLMTFLSFNRYGKVYEINAWIFSTIWETFIIFALLLVGNAIAALTHYAFKKEILWKRMLSGLASFSLVMILSWGVYSFYGNPIEYFLLNQRVYDYLEAKYPDEEFYIDFKHYDSKANKYHIFVQETETNVHFSIDFHVTSGNMYDNYEINKLYLID